jgi:hypothetical protein
MTPAVEHLRGHPPWPQSGWYAAPFGAVLMPPDDRFDRPAQILGCGFAMRTAGLDQELWRKLGDGVLNKAAYRGGWKPA